MMGACPAFPRSGHAGAPLLSSAPTLPLTIVVTAAVSVWRAHVYGAAWLILITNTLQPGHLLRSAVVLPVSNNQP